MVLASHYGSQDAEGPSSEPERVPSEPKANALRAFWGKPPRGTGGLIAAPFEIAARHCATGLRQVCNATPV